MDPIVIGLIGFGAVFALLAVGLPIGIGMLLVGVVGLAYFTSGNIALVNAGLVSFATVCNYSFIVLPLFLLMANIAYTSGITRDAYDVAAKWLGHQRGGLAMATVVGSGVFAAVSSSSVASASAMGVIALPEMKRYKYHPQLATGSIAAGGTMGVLIPPSGVLIIYGILTETSISKLFIAGLVPGVIEIIFYIITIFALCAWNPALGPRGAKYSLMEKVKSLSKFSDMLLLVFLVLGGLLIGWFTPTEAGAVGAFGAISLSLIRGRLNWQIFKQALMDTMKTTGMVFCILIGAIVFNYFLAVSTMPAELAKLVGGLPLSPMQIMLLIIVVYTFLGCFLDAMAMVLLTIPTFFPVAIALGFHPIWFGIILVRVMEIAMITPPIGMNVYVIAGIAKDVPMTTIFKGTIPFVIADICQVVFMLFLPITVMYLPGLM